MPVCAGAAEPTQVRKEIRNVGKVPAETKRVLRALEVSLLQERRAQQELVYFMSARVLDLSLIHISEPTRPY